MNRFLYNLRKAYNEHSAIFISLILLLNIFFYLSPLEISDGHVNSGYIHSWRRLSFILEISAERGELPLTWFGYIFPLVLCALNIIILALAYKHPKLIFASMPFFIYSLYLISRPIKLLHSFVGGYSIFYLLLVILCLLFFILLALALFLPLKEPAPRTPRPRKPTKSERIAELERQVEELKRDNQKDA